MNAHSPVPGNIAALPPALAPMVAERRWVVWRWEANDKGKRTKVPYDADRPAIKASSTDPKTWSGYTAARGVATAGLADGIGYCLHGGDVAAFDLDDAIAPDGTILTWAWDLIDECSSYTERTIGGSGLRILGRAAGAKVHRKQKVPGTPSSLETYRVAERYIVVTGASLDGFGDELRNIDGPVDAWVAKLDAAAKAEKDREREAKAEARAHAKSKTTGERFAEHVERARVFSGSGLPRELDELVRYGVKEGRRSEKFMHAVGWLKDLGHSPADIEGILAAHPTGIAEKFIDRLRAEVDRCYDKADTKHRATGGAPDDGFGPSPGAKAEPAGPALLFYGDVTPEPPPWLIRNVLPQQQVAILAGQHSAGKTFIGIDISLSTMTGLPFIDNEVVRRGAVLWLAAEGASEVTIRLKAAAVHRLGREAAGELPFAFQIADVPTLSEPDALSKLMRLVTEMKERLARDFPGVELALIVLDTLNSAAGFNDENSASEAQKVFNVLRQLSNASGALALVIDHYGKISETGVRGSSAKAGAADAILAALANKDEITGKVDNRRLAVVKLRSAPTGRTVPFTLKPVPVDPFGNTHCGIEWDAIMDLNDAAPQKAEKQAWSGDKARMLKGSIERMLIEHGTEQQPFGLKGPKVKAVHLDRVREEFCRTYPGETAEAKSKAYRRALADAGAKSLIGTREIGASLTDWIWFVKEGDSLPE